jgi:hypothetical protein
MKIACFIGRLTIVAQGIHTKKCFSLTKWKYFYNIGQLGEKQGIPQRNISGKNKSKQNIFSSEISYINQRKIENKCLETGAKSRSAQT